MASKRTKEILALALNRNIENPESTPSTEYISDLSIINDSNSLPENIFSTSDNILSAEIIIDQSFNDFSETNSDLLPITYSDILSADIIIADQNIENNVTAIQNENENLLSTAELFSGIDVTIEGNNLIEYTNQSIEANVDDIEISNENSSSLSSEESSDTNDSVKENNLSEKRKRCIEANTDKWKRLKTKKRRMLGKDYIGYQRKEKTITHNVHRSSREMATTCKSKACLRLKNRFCHTFKEEERLQIFKKFWENTWEEKKIYTRSLVSKIPKKRDTVDEVNSRRNFTYIYQLKYKNNVPKQVCKRMFLGTLGLREWMVHNWLHDDMTKQEITRNTNDTTDLTQSSSSLPKGSKATRMNHFKKWLESLPKLPSHYCRKDTERLYLEGPFHTKKEVYDLYVQKCVEDNISALSICIVSRIMKLSKLSIFAPRKDQCDICSSYSTKQIDETEYINHIKSKDRAREEKDLDKKEALKGECCVLTMDLQAVKLCPKLNASALYYSMKLKVHNFTMYNVGNSQCSNYWWHESDGELDASVFASIITEHLEQYCNHTNIILYSDGCGYQNRNSVLSNALLNYAIKKNVTIEQKFLTKGHTQMECDSVHSLIERKLKNKDIYLPSDYVKITKEARTNPAPYEAKLLDYTFFKKYNEKNSHIYNSIRPGKLKGDPEVKDIRALKYDPTAKRIYYKLNFDESYNELPQRVNKVSDVINYKPLYNAQVPLTLSKWQDLQKLRSVLPKDTHSFYNELPHAKSLTEKIGKI